MTDDDDEIVGRIHAPKEITLSFEMPPEGIRFFEGVTLESQGLTEQEADRIIRLRDEVRKPEPEGSVSEFASGERFYRESGRTGWDGLDDEDRDVWERAAEQVPKSGPVVAAEAADVVIGFLIEERFRAIMRQVRIAADTESGPNRHERRKQAAIRADKSEKGIPR